MIGKRTIKPCVECGQIKVISARGQCGRCWHYTRVGRPIPPLGTFASSPWTPAKRERALEYFHEDISVAHMALLLNMTKNQVSGWLWRQGMRRRAPYMGPTMMDRLDALHENMSKLLAHQAIQRAKGSYYKPFLYDNDVAALMTS
jgi:hypothetical protein